jgi:hypothetical protein
MSVSIYDPNLFKNLMDGAEIDGVHQDGLTVFRTLVARTYNQVAERFSASFTFSYDRTEEAYEYWKRDVARVYDGEDAVPDHFKRAGFLAYWLRRRQVVSRLAADQGFEGDQRLRERFLINHNEYSAFLFGFRICIYFELDAKLRESADISDYIGAHSLDPRFVLDVSTLMKNKNVSPHSLYLIYRACFIDLQRPPMSRPVEVLPFPAG